MKGTAIDPICGPDKKQCWKDVVLIMNAKEFKSINILNGSFMDIDKCNCLPTCTTISYNTEISQATISWKTYVDGLTKGNKHYKKYFINLLLLFFDTIFYFSIKLSKIRIHYKNKKVLTLKRSEFYGEAAFLASCGGFLGLFMGFSILSLVEIFYFSTIRVLCNYLMRKKVFDKSELILVKESKMKLNTIY